VRKYCNKFTGNWTDENKVIFEFVNEDLFIRYCWFELSLSIIRIIRDTQLSN
jgi:hypothetical protein